jgi:hypothetical protein
VQPFVRFGNTVFAPEELELARFEAFGDVAEPFAAVGLGRLDVLAPPRRTATATPMTPRAPAGSRRPFSSPRGPASELTPGTPPSAKGPR